MADNAVFVDTNVLVYAGRPATPRHRQANELLKRLEENGCRLWISPQVMREYLAVVTRPQGHLAAMVPDDAVQDVRHFSETFNIATETPSVFMRFLQLMRAAQVQGAQVHDTHLVATMLEYGISRLLTFNVRDFRRFSGYIELETV